MRLDAGPEKALFYFVLLFSVLIVDFRIQTSGLGISQATASFTQAEAFSNPCPIQYLMKLGMRLSPRCVGRSRLFLSSVIGDEAAR